MYLSADSQSNVQQWPQTLHLGGGDQELTAYLIC